MARIRVRRCAHDGYDGVVLLAVPEPVPDSKWPAARDGDDVRKNTRVLSGILVLFVLSAKRYQCGEPHGVFK